MNLQKNHACYSLHDRGAPHVRGCKSYKQVNDLKRINGTGQRMGPWRTFFSLPNLSPDICLRPSDSGKLWSFAFYPPLDFSSFWACALTFLKILVFYKGPFFISNLSLEFSSSCSFTVKIEFFLS